MSPPSLDAFPAVFCDPQLYYERGYWRDITREMSCVVMEQIFQKMDEARQAEQDGET